MGDRLEQLLVRPARLEGVLVVDTRRRALRLEDAADVGEDLRLTLVAGLELPRERDLVEAQPRVARGPLERGEGVCRSLVLGYAERDPLLRLERELTVAQLRAEPRVGPQSGGRALKHGDEVRQLATSGQSALQHRQTALWRGQLVVDLETAFLRLHRRHFTFGRLLTNSKYTCPFKGHPT